MIHKFIAVHRGARALAATALVGLCLAALLGGAAFWNLPGALADHIIGDVDDDRDVDIQDLLQIVGDLGTVNVRSDTNNDGTVDVVDLALAALRLGETSPEPSAIDQPPGMVSWWPGDNHSQDIQDGNHGLLIGDTSFGAGKVAEAFSFDGDGDVVEVLDNDNLDFGRGDSMQFSVDAWIKIQPGDFGGIVSKSAGEGAVGYRLSVVPVNGTLEAILEADNGVDIILQGRTRVNDGRFHHVAMTWDGHLVYTLTLYVDGAEDGSETVHGVGSLANDQPLRIGPEDFRGLIDEVEVFRRPLSAEEVDSIHLAGSAGKVKPPCPPGVGQNLKGQNLRGADFEGQNLSCSDLSDADLSLANLRDVNLSDAVLTRTILEGADLTSADLSGADLMDANLMVSHLRQINLTNANLQGANLFGADFTGANITNAHWNNTRCPDGSFAFPEPSDQTSCAVSGPVGPPAPLPLDYPSATLAIGGDLTHPADIVPVRVEAVWDACPRLIVEEESTPFTRVCVQGYSDAGIVYLPYHPLGWVEHGFTGYEGIMAAYPDLPTNGLWMDFDGNINLRGGGAAGGDAVPTFSNSSDTWLDFMIGVIKTQVDAGMTGIGFDEGWGSLGPGPVIDTNPESIEGFRRYLEARYTPQELAAKGIDDIATFNWREAIGNREVLVLANQDPGAPLSPEWWEEQLGRVPQPGETYTNETFELVRPYARQSDPLLGLMHPEWGDYNYYLRMRLREVYVTLQSEIKPYAAALGQPWYLSGNIYNELSWGNAAVGAAVMDLPFGELTNRDVRWPSRNFTSFFKNMAAMGKRYNPMFYPGQVLHPANDEDTEALPMFLADVYASGGVTQHPGPQYNALVNPYFGLIQTHENFFAQTDNRVALYYSLGNHMGDVGREGEETWTYYGVARLLEDSHYSYDVLYQGDPDMGPGTVRWVDKQVTLADMQEYQVIILPQTRYMTEAEVENFLAFMFAGGILVVFGDAGTRDFGFPAPSPRNNPAWNNLVGAEGSRNHGDGMVLVFPSPGGQNIARNYDGTLSIDDLVAFQTGFGAIYTSDVDTSLGKDVHIHKFHDPSASLEVFHLVNFDYDDATDRVVATDNQTFAFDPSRDPVQPKVTYYTPASPDGVVLPINELPSGMLEVTLPTLHIYGVVVLEDLAPPPATPPVLSKLADLPGGHISDIAFAPSDPNVAYLASNVNAMGIWRSDDGGENWRRIFYDISQPGATHTNNLAIHPTDSDTLLATDLHGRIVRTTNGGQTWEEVHESASPKWWVSYAPSDAQTLYAGAADGRLLRSADGGDRWTVLVRVPCGALSIAVHPTDASKIYIGTCGGQIYVMHIGVGFDLLHQLPDAVVGLALSPTDPNLIFAASASGLFVSRDGGTNWDEVLNTQAHSVQVAPADAQVVYAGTHEGVFKSSDSGATWTNRSSGIAYQDVGPLAIHPQDKDVVLIGNNIWRWASHNHPFPTSTEGEGIYKTTDGGLSWAKKVGGFRDVDVVTVAVDPNDPDVAYVGVECSRGIFRTVDGGASWEFISGGPDDGSWDIGHYTMRLVTDSEGKLWMTGRFGLARSADRGESWQQFLVRRHFHGIAIHPDDPDTIFVGTSPKQDPTEVFAYPNGRIVYSHDGGQTWQEPAEGFPAGTHTSVHDFVFDPFDDNTVYVSTSRHEIGLPPTNTSVGVYKSTDRGRTWQEINNGLPASRNVDTIVASPARPGLLFAGTDQKVFRSDDGGASWQGPILRGEVHSLLVDPVQTNWIYAGTETGLFWSADGGVNWQRLGSVPQQTVAGLAMDPQGRALYAAVNDEGVYKWVRP